MAISSLQQLAEHTTIVPETAKLDVVQDYAHLAKPRHVNLSTSKISAAAREANHAKIVDDAVAWAQRSVGKAGNRKLVAIKAVDRLKVEFAQEMLALVAGQVSIEVDGRLAHKRRAMIDAARALMGQLAELGIDTDRVLLKLPATWQGIQAAHKLHEKDGYRCHLTLVFGMHQLAACADAGAAIVSPPVGRISDWHKKDRKVDGFEIAEDPGVLAALDMQAYLADHSYETNLMPTMFRGVEQVLALASCPLLSLPPKLLAALEQGETSVEVATCQSPPSQRLQVDQPVFNRMHAADRCSSSKLQAAVQNMSWAVVSQEKQLIEWIASRQDREAESSALALFKIWDYDGDGFIDREEWGGTDEVFNALDRDHNGRVSLEEMAIGLGAPCIPED